MFRPINYVGRLKSELKCIENSDISGENKDIIFEFYEYFRLQGISPARLDRELKSLRHICQRFSRVLDGKTLRELDEGSARKLAIEIEIETFSSEKLKRK